MIDELAQQLLDDPPPNSVWRMGTVTAIAPALLVKVGASTTGQPCRSAVEFALAVNDYVIVLVNGPDRIVVARIPGKTTPADIGAEASAPLNPTTTITAVTGATVSPTLATGDQCTITAFFDVSKGGATTNVFRGYLYIAGAQQGRQAILRNDNATGRNSVGQQWQYTAVGNGAVTFDLRADVSVAGAGYTVQATHTNLLVRIRRF